MGPAKPSSAEEDAFMNDLLSGINDSFFDAVPTPDPSPAKPPPPQSHAPIAHSVLTTPTKPRKIRRYTPSPVKRRVTSPAIGKSFVVGDLDVEDAAGWDWDAISDYVPTPKKPPSSKQKVPLPVDEDEYEPEPCTRCIILAIEDVWVGDNFEKHLVADTDPAQERRSIILRDDWVHTDLHVGDVVNIIGSFVATPGGPPSIELTSLNHLLIHHPDLLLTPSTLASAPHCIRRPLLTALLRSSTPTTPVLVYGNVLHAVFQRCLRERRYDQVFIDARVDEALHEVLGDLVRIGITVEAARHEVLERAKGLRVFGERYVASRPKPDAVLSNTRAERGSKSLLAITQLHDVEEDIWSPTYGLKGKLDASIQASITTTASSSKATFLAPTPTSHPAPLEIKTGRALGGMEHRAQTMLYTLLMGERYGARVDQGLLYYTQSEEVIAVPAARHELRALVSVRNAIAEWMAKRFREEEKEIEGQHVVKEKKFLPVTIDDERICGRCYSVDACMLYRKAVENVVDTTSPIADIYEAKTGHLTPSQAAFFKDWERLIALEEHDMTRFKKELWTLGAAEREEKGRCFAGMVLDPSFDATDYTGPKGARIHQFTYRFRRQNPKDTPSLLNGHMAAGDAVTVSIAPDLLALSRGYILELAPAHIIIGVDHELSLSTIRARLATRPRVRRAAADQAPVFRIDKDEFSGGMGRVRDSLAALFYAGGDATRLRLVVDLAAPRFDPRGEAPLRAAVRASDACRALARGLNSSQIGAVDRVLCARDYTLVLGMPGTGKTTLVAALIRILVEMGKTVLLTAYTHSAVDTILAKLDGAEFGILRLGNVDKVKPELRKYTLSARKEAKTVEELERQLMTPPVVATTALSIDHELFSRREFDYCIVDEASQITLPTCLGPLRFAQTFVLVGDHYQLPPLVRNREAQRGGLDVSLFRRLSEAHPNAVVDLTHQYRMNADIMLLANKLVYSDRLKCGTETVARQSLVLPDRSYLQGMHNICCSSDGLCWLEQLMDPHARAVFVDTDRLPALDSRVGDLVQNTLEGALVHQIVETMLRCGVRETQVGVITMYRQQIKLLSQLLLARPDVEILTADRSQGRDKECIVISMVRSNESGHIGDLVRDWRRLNVAFTRARSKLIIVGSRRTLQRTPLLEAFFALMEERKWVLSLPPRAHLLHELPELGTPGKRAREAATIEDGRVKDVDTPRTAKKLRMGEDVALLRTRPILKDMFNDSL